MYLHRLHITCHFKTKLPIGSHQGPGTGFPSYIYIHTHRHHLTMPFSIVFACAWHAWLVSQAKWYGAPAKLFCAPKSKVHWRCQVYPDASWSIHCTLWLWLWDVVRGLIPLHNRKHGLRDLACACCESGAQGSPLGLQQSMVPSGRCLRCIVFFGLCSFKHMSHVVSSYLNAKSRSWGRCKRVPM